jgi:L-iditol 2-dehydrogenase
MKAVMLTALKKLEIKDIPQPTIQKDTDVLLKIEYVGVCGSDVHYFSTGRIGSQVVQYPYIIGHECSATVTQIGPKVTRVKVGDTVAVNPAVSCHQCEQCRMGRENTCYNLSFLGTPGQGPGCMTEYMVMPEETLFLITGKLSLEQGVICEPLAISAYSVQQSRLKKGDNIAVLGAGPIGLTCLLTAHAEGAGKTFMTEIIPERIQIARAKADWVGNPQTQDIVSDILQHKPLGLDIVYECAGQQETVDQALGLLRPGGILVLVGIHRQTRIEFNMEHMRRKEISVVNIRRQNHCDQKAVDLIASGAVDIDFMVTHKFDIEQAQQAFELVADYRDGVIKALIRL